jgi:hypothetical protein
MASIMPNAHSIDIVKIQCLPEFQGKQNVAQSIDFLIVATDSDNNCAAIEKTLHLVLDNLVEFTEFKNLTKEQVIQWITNHYNPLSMQAFYDDADTALKMFLLATNQQKLPWETEFTAI